ncbi:MAG: hypothetical protein A2Z18_05060 [Armatimonadetes bacterium RBG_16_58_9]|nr:MAG: hypothetical protein A2Z18_05060 [Armatimonadetes bacterium RBG_16_58_9]
MKKRRLARLMTLGVVALVALVVAAGCGGGGGGKKTQDLTSPWDGTLAGVATQPDDGETDIDVDSWIRVYWPDEGYPPPREFTVRLEKEEHPDDWGGVHTIYRRDYSDPSNGDWWFEPTSYFSRSTWYRIVITDSYTHDAVIAYFLTTGLLTGASSERASASATAAVGKKYRPAGAENAPLSGGEGAVEHTIKTGK